MNNIKSLILSEGGYYSRTKFEIWDFNCDMKCKKSKYNRSVEEGNSYHYKSIYNVTKEFQDQILNLCNKYSNFENIIGTDLEKLVDGSTISLEILYSDKKKIKKEFNDEDIPECVNQLNDIMNSIVANSNFSRKKILECEHQSSKEIGPGDWVKTIWIIYDNLTFEINNICRNNKGLEEKNEIYNGSIENIIYNNIIEKLNLANVNDEKNEACDGDVWNFKQYENDMVIYERDTGYIYGNEKLEDVANILKELLNEFNKKWKSTSRKVKISKKHKKFSAVNKNYLTKNLDRQELSKVLDMFHQEIKDIQPKDIDTSIYLKYLEMLKYKLYSVEYTSDNRFVTYCRRDFLRQEMTDRLNQKVYTGIDYMLEAFYDLEDYINNDTWISIGSVWNFPNSKEIIDNDNSYKNDGKICKEEKEILIDMIEEFINKIISEKLDIILPGF